METDVRLTLWEHHLRHAADEATRCQTEVIGRRPLALRKGPPSQLTPFDRPANLSQVDANLLGLFRKLGAGEAAWPLYLHGGAGRGKTSAAMSFARVVLSSKYFTVEDVVSSILSGNWRGTYPSGLRYANGQDSPNINLAILDELGCRQNVTDLHYQAIWQFADEREGKYGRVAIYISNLSPKELRAIYDDRICSRILCGTWFELVGPDRRFSE